MSLLNIVIYASQNLFFSLAGILGIGFLIGFHELGHFLFCKAFNIHTPSFSIGFGPRILTKKIGDTEFALSAIPLGGYVEIAGSAEVGQGEQKNAHATDKRSFASKPFYQKLLVMFGGIMFNLAFAYFAFILLFATGLPKSPMLYPLNATPTVEQIIEKTAADKAHLQAGDTILALNDTKIDGNVELLVRSMQKMPGESITLLIDREGRQKRVKATLDATKRGNTTYGTLGVHFTFRDMPPLPLGQAISQGVYVTNRYISNFLTFVKRLFTKQDLSGAGGPIMMITETVKGAQKGWKIFLLFLAVISINLAVLNLIPLPILDGGQILTHTIEAVIGRSIPIKIKEYVFISCWVLFLALTAYLSYKDILRYLKPLWVYLVTGQFSE